MRILNSRITVLVHVKMIPSFYLRGMYNLPHFKASDHSEVIPFMQQHPFAVICGVDANNKPVATHVPVLLEERGGKIFLQAHVMRRQEHTKAFEVNPEVLVIFSGAHTYISASWYEAKATPSTWNYKAVHAKGILKFLDEEGLYKLLVKLTETFEQDPASPSLVPKMNKEDVSNMMKAIIAFEIVVTDIQHIFKLSQNRDQKSFDNIITALSDKDADAQKIAEEMQEIKPGLFPG